MHKLLTARASLVFALAAALSASPALAQGKAKGAEKERAKQAREFKGEQKRPELRRRTEERRETRERREARERRDERYDERYEGRYDPRLERSDREGRRVPPGWCKGRGNPHNTPENCGYGARGRHDDRYDDRDDRYEDRDGRYDDYGRSGSFEQEHQEFHRYLDRKYSELASRRPLDLPYQIRLRAEKRAEHQQWHERAGRGH